MSVCITIDLLPFTYDAVSITIMWRSLCRAYRSLQEAAKFVLKGNFSYIYVMDEGGQTATLPVSLQAFPVTVESHEVA